MPRFAADTLDVSRLPPPQAVQIIDYEAILAARVTDLKARLAAVGITWDTDVLETDPLKVLEEVDAGREVLDLAAINNAVRAVMVPLATGADLNHLAAFYGVARMPVVTEPRPYAQFPEDWETDARFRLRALLAPEAFAAAGPVGAYVFQALTADHRVKDVGVRILETQVELAAGGTALDRVVEVAVLSSVGNGIPTDEVVTNVRLRLLRKDIKPLTDVVSVVPAQLANYTVTAALFIPPGPDPALIIQQAGAALDAMAADANRVGRVLFLNAIRAAAHVAPVRNVVLSSPVADVGNGARQAPRMAAKNLSVSIIDE